MNGLFVDVTVLIGARSCIVVENVFARVARAIVSVRSLRQIRGTRRHPRRYMTFSNSTISTLIDSFLCYRQSFATVSCIVDSIELSSSRHAASGVETVARSGSTRRRQQNDARQFEYCHVAEPAGVERCVRSAASRQRVDVVQRVV